MTTEQGYIERLRGKVASSAYVMSLSPGAEATSDAKFVYETGMAVLLDKPIIVVSWPGRAIPAGLRRIAHRVIELQAPLASDAGQQQLMAELAGAMGRDS